MIEAYNRIINLIGQDNFTKLNQSKVLVVGVGGVGGYVCEMLVRNGVGQIDVVDSDKVNESNINRQIIATSKTIDKSKVDVIKERLQDINPLVKVNTYNMFLDETTINEIELNQYDYICDCIDTVKSKILLIKTSLDKGLNIISSMGTGNKLDPTKFKITDISKTHTCPLAKTVRYELRKLNINHLKVLFSEEIPLRVLVESENSRHIPASYSCCVSVSGILIADSIIKDLMK